MTNKQPEALRLADECDEGIVDFAEVATELRRLSAWNAHLTVLAKQRDELLEALKELMSDEAVEDGMRWADACDKARAAIARVEGEKK